MGVTQARYAGYTAAAAATQKAAMQQEVTPMKDDTPVKTETKLKLVCQDAYKHIDERIIMSVHKSCTVAKWLAVVNAFPDIEGFAISRAQKTVAYFALGRLPK